MLNFLWAGLPIISRNAVMAVVARHGGGLRLEPLAYGTWAMVLLPKRRCVCRIYTVALPNWATLLGQTRTGTASFERSGAWAILGALSRLVD